MWIKRKDYNNLISDLEHYRKSADELERAIYEISNGKSVYFSNISHPGFFFSNDKLDRIKNRISELENEIERLKNDKLELESIARYYEYKYAELKVKQNEEN